MRVKNLEQLEKLLARARGGSSDLPAVLSAQELQTRLHGTSCTAANGQTSSPQMQQEQVRIVGLDVALRCTGWGIVDVRRARHGAYVAVDCGVVRNPPKEPVSECLKNLSATTRELIRLYKPDLAVLEGGFYSRNVRTAVVLGAARGAVISQLAEADVTVFEYAPRRIKQAICGFGNASKQQVARIVSQLLNIQVDSISNDSTDALAMALTHAYAIASPSCLDVPPPI